MSYDSNLERDEYPQQYDHDYYGQSNYNQELEINRHEMFYDSNLELDDEKSITQELGFNGYENFMERYLQELHTVLAPLEKSFATWILEQCKIFAQRVESFEKLEECLEKLQHSLVHLMKNDLTQELKLGGHKMPYDFNLEKTNFSLENNDQFTKDDEESETKSMKWSDINPLDDLTQECKMPYDLHFEKNDFSMENDQSAKDKELSDEKFTNDLTQEIKLEGQELSYDFILGDDDLKWQGNANESMGFCYSKIKTKHMRNYGCRTKFLVMSLKLNTHAGYLNLMI
jgi:hypothetical protein